jgi:hypothetical protein
MRFYSPLTHTESSRDALAFTVPELNNATILAAWRCKQIDYWSDEEEGIFALDFVL